VDLREALELQNRGMIAFDLALGGGALLAPDATLKAMGHSPPSDDARELFRRCAPIWLTFAAAHIVADRRGRPEDWWALAWLRGTELFTDALWARSPGFRDTRTRATLVGAGVANLGMSLGFGWLARRSRRRRRLR
jgi:hypothetical protein